MGTAQLKLPSRKALPHGHALRVFDDSLPVLDLIYYRLILDSSSQFSPHYRTLYAHI